uniref:Uncharacterized protein n=1 Tax=Glossina pallidipes TaxID=7398 RepID=A0A1B0AJP4_GLOPL
MRSNASAAVGWTVVNISVTMLQKTYFIPGQPAVYLIRITSTDLEHSLKMPSQVELPELVILFIHSWDLFKWRTDSSPLVQKGVPILILGQPMWRQYESSFHKTKTPCSVKDKNEI